MTVLQIPVNREERKYAVRDINIQNRTIKAITIPRQQPRCHNEGTIGEPIRQIGCKAKKIGSHIGKEA
jgi:hypothetical protein